MKTAIIPADAAQPVRVEDVKAINLDYLNDRVGGYIQAVGLQFIGDAADDDLIMYLNEEGKLEGLPYNPRATALAYSVQAIFPSDYIVGDVVIVGAPDSEGNETGLDDEAAEALITIFTLDS